MWCGARARSAEKWGSKGRHSRIVTSGILCRLIRVTARVIIPSEGFATLPNAQAEYSVLAVEYSYICRVYNLPDKCVGASNPQPLPHGDGAIQVQRQTPGPNMRSYLCCDMVFKQMVCFVSQPALRMSHNTILSLKRMNSRWSMEPSL